MKFSIIIASFDRADSLDRLMTGLSEVFAKSPVDFEVLLANNARDDDSCRHLESVIAKFADILPGRVRGIREPDPGKCRAQNRAIGESTGDILVFFDDDIQLTPDWLPVTAKFFQEKPHYQAMQGPILMPEEFRNDQKFLRAHQRYRTINFVQYRANMTDLRTLTGANMVIRRGVFDKVGLFNEALGPGRSGISEDVEFAQRMIDSGMRIGYEPAAGVVHEVDWRRLTEEFFRQRHEQQGRSRLIYKKQNLASILPNLLRSVWTLGWYSLIGNERKKYRAKGRFFHYRAMAMEKLK